MNAKYHDLYIVKYLYQAVKRPGNQIPWEKTPSGGYSASISHTHGEKMDFEISRVQSRPDPRIFLRISNSKYGTVSIAEPLPKVSLRKKFDTQDETELSEYLSLLLVTIANGVAQKELQNSETEEERKQKIYERLFNIPL